MLIKPLLDFIRRQLFSLRHILPALQDINIGKVIIKAINRPFNWMSALASFGLRIRVFMPSDAAVRQIVRIRIQRQRFFNLLIFYFLRSFRLDRNSAEVVCNAGQCPDRTVVPLCTILLEQPRFGPISNTPLRATHRSRSTVLLKVPLLEDGGSGGSIR